MTSPVWWQWGRGSSSAPPLWGEELLGQQPDAASLLLGLCERGLGHFLLTQKPVEMVDLWMAAGSISTSVSTWSHSQAERRSVPRETSRVSGPPHTGLAEETTTEQAAILVILGHTSTEVTHTVAHTADTLCGASAELDDAAV